MWQTLTCYAGGNAITLTIGSNVEWTASIDNGASLKIGDAAAATSVNGNEDTVVTVVIPENEAGETYTISFSTTLKKSFSDWCNILLPPFLLL